MLLLHEAQGDTERTESVVKLLICLLDVHDTLNATRPKDSDPLQKVHTTAEARTRLGVPAPVMLRHGPGAVNLPPKKQKVA